MHGLIARFLPSLLPGLSAFANPWALVIAGGLLVAGFIAGWKVEGWRWDASLTAAAQAYADNLKKFIENQRLVVAEIQGRLDEEKRLRALAEKKADREIEDAPPSSLVSTKCPKPAGDAAATVAGAPGPVVPLPAAQPGDGGDVLLTVEYQRLWNHAVVLAGSEGERGPWLDAAHADAGPVEVKETLRAAKQLGALLGECRTRELGWHRTACRQGWWVGEQCR